MKFTVHNFQDSNRPNQCRKRNSTVYFRRTFAIAKNVRIIVIILGQHGILNIR